MDRDENSYSEKEFSDIFNKYWSQLYALAYKYTGDTDLSKTIVQNIFLTLWRREVPLRNEIEIQKYLTRAVKYQVFKSFSNGNKVLAIPLEDVSENETHSADDPHQCYIGRESKNHIENIIAELNEPTRTIFRMSRYDLLTHKEIAARIGVSVKTVEYHITKSLHFIRRRYKNYF